MGVKISELNSVEELQNEDVFPVVQDGETKKVSKEQLLGQIGQQIETNTEDISNIKQEQETQNTQISKNEDDIEELQVIKADRTEIPTNLNQLSNADTKFVNETQMANAVQQETTARQQQDVELQNQIDAITSQSDVVDIVGTYAELQDYDTSTITENDIIKVLQDSTHDNATSYFRWANNLWSYVGSEGPYYTKGETDERLNLKANQTSLDQTNQNLNTLSGRVGTNETEITGIKAEQTTQNRQIATLIADSGNKIELSVNSQTYILTATLKNKAGEILNSSQIDLPLEAMIVNAEYDSTTKELVLTLQNGTKLRVSLADIVSGLVSQDDFDGLEVRVETLETDVEDIKNEQQTQNTEIEELQEQVEILENTVNSELEDATATGEEISVTDSANAPAKLLPSGRTYQATNIKTYECEGTETGDYYFTYNSINYQFTMPTIEEGSVLAFNTDTLKLYLGDTEITTTIDNTGTLITLQYTPNPKYSQDIHVVKGHNEFLINNSNLFNSENWYETLHNISETSMIKEIVNDILYYKFRPIGLNEYIYMEGQFKENVQYRLIFKGRNYANRADASTGFRFLYTDGTSSTRWITTATETEYELISDAGKTIRGFVVPYNLNEFVLVRDILLTEGISQIPYFPYQEQRPEFTLEEGQNMYKGGYLADNGIHNVRKQLVLDGTENWEQGSSAKVFYLSLPNRAYNKTPQNGCISNYFIGIPYTTGLAGINKGEFTFFKYTGAATQSVYELYINYDTTATVEQFKQFLADKYASGNPVIVEFDAYEEIIVPYTETQQQQYNKLKKILSHFGGTNITTISAGDLNPILNLDYKKSNRLRDDNQDQEIENIKARLDLLEG